MQELGGVEVFQGPEELVHDVALVDVLEDVGTQHRVQVRLHVFEDEVDVALVLGLGDVEQPALAGRMSGMHRGTEGRTTGNGALALRIVICDTTHLMMFS